MHGAAAPEPRALLVVHAWLHGTPPRVVARITSTLDVTRPDRVTVSAAGLDEITTEVRRWLEAVAEAQPGDERVTPS
jgi:hypothetical protein